MAPIGVGIIGLSSTGGWAVTAHLPYLSKSDKYKITGVCNSSIASSEAAIKTHGLPTETKAYGSVADLAASPDVDLVVCATRVDRHYESIKPALAAGKDCFVEWPLASNLEQATELQQLAEQKGVRTMIGLQGQMSPAIRRVKDLIEKEQVLGRLISSNVTLAGTLGASATNESHEYLDAVETGGNMLVIPFAHLYDSVSFALGELQSLSSTLSTQHRSVEIKSADGSHVLKTIQRTTADQVTLSGILEKGAQSSAIVYGGQPFKGEPALLWRIEGDKGILQIRGEQTFAISMSLSISIKLQLFATGEVQDVDFVEDTPGPSGNVGRLYEAFADGQYYPDWKWAVKRHAWAEALYRSNETGKRVSYL